MLLPELRVPITGDNRALRAALAGARRDLTVFEQQANRDAQRVNASVGRMVGIQAGLLKAFAVAAAAKQVTDYADAWTIAGNKIAAASQVAGRQARSLSDLNDIANETRTGLTETADLYAKLLRATASVADSEEEVARATEIVNKAFKAGGAAASEQTAGILQLAQALGSGVLQGDELRSIRENAPLVAAAIAEEFDTTVAGLKKLGSEGKLTSDRIFDAILAAAPKVEAAFAVTQGTIGDSWTVLQNRITESVGSLDQAFGVTQSVRTEFQNLGTAIEDVVGWLLDMQQSIENIDARWRTWTGTINDWASALGRIPFSAQGRRAAGGAANLQELLGTAPSAGDLAIRGAFRAAESSPADIELRRALQAQVRARNTPSTPAFGTGSGAGLGGTTGSGRSPAEKFADDIEAIQRRTEAMRLDTEMLGRNTYERERAEAVLRLEQEARRAGIADIEPYRAQIEAEAEAYARASEALEERTNALRAAQEAQQFLAAGLADLAMSNSLEEMGQSAEKLVQSLKRAVIEALLLGQGPLAGIFGTQNRQGGVGGIFGKLLGIGVSALGGGAGGATGAAVGSFRAAQTMHSGAWSVGPGSGRPRFVHPAVFADAPRYHSGLGMRERPAILEDGEMVIPAGLASAIRGGRMPGSGGGSGEVNVKISQEQGITTQVRSARRRQDGGFDLDILARQVVDMVGNEYGLAPRLRPR